MSERLTDEGYRAWIDDGSPNELEGWAIILSLRAENERLTRERDAASKLWRSIAETDSAGVRELRGENDQAYSYAVGFLRAFIDNNDQRQVEPLPTLTGVLTQIDNATTITKSLRAENERLREELRIARMHPYGAALKDAPQ